MGRRLLVSLGVVVALIAAAVIAGGAYTALKNPLQTKPNSNLTPENCSPGPCTNLQGYTIWISKIYIDKDIVHLTVKFQNSSTSTHAAPEDLVLIDSERRQSAPGVKVTLRNFGRDRRYPIVNRFRDPGTPPPQPDPTLLAPSATPRNDTFDF